jgi:predicted neutral ceramidase superfamily lipid hydrolase
MWPRILLDLLPHFARLMPMADKYLASRSASDKAQETALAALAEKVRGQVTEAHEGINRQLREQSAQLGEISVDVARGRMGTESVEARVAKLEKSAGAAAKLIWAVLGLLVVATALLTILVVRVLR